MDRPPDASEARRAWDRAADAYARGQAAGRDVYRYAFFGPAQVAACGEVEGARLLDVGCGAGYFAREMATRGARVTGVDLSPAMVEHALRREAEAPLGIAYEVLDAVDVEHRFGAGAFDVATSCFALQDMADPAGVLRAVHGVLTPGGRFLASLAHPCTDTPSRAWQRGPDGTKQALCIDRYFDEGPRVFTWKGWGEPFTTPATHATLTTWLAWVADAGFRVAALTEPRPSEATVREHPELEDARRVPYVLLLDLRRD